MNDTQQVIQNKNPVNIPFTSNYNKEKEALQYVQKHFNTLVDSCRDTISVFIL